jgi:hypothetical protein
VQAPQARRRAAPGRAPAGAPPLPGSAPPSSSSAVPERLGQEVSAASPSGWRALARAMEQAERPMPSTAEAAPASSRARSAASTPLTGAGGQRRIELGEAELGRGALAPLLGRAAVSRRRRRDLPGSGRARGSCRSGRASTWSPVRVSLPTSAALFWSLRPGLRRGVVGGEHEQVAVDVVEMSSGPRRSSLERGLPRQRQRRVHGLIRRSRRSVMPRPHEDCDASYEGVTGAGFRGSRGVALRSSSARR